MKLQIHTFDLPLRDTFTISRESHDVQPTLIVELSDGTHSGFGEATANPYYQMTVERMRKIVESVRPDIENYSFGTPEDTWAQLHRKVGNYPFVQCAIDLAMHDLYSRRREQKLYEHWQLDPDRVPISNYTIGIDRTERMVEKMRALPWPIYKIKLGTDRDLTIIEELRRHTAATFRVDANCGWTAEQTIAYAPALKKLGVEFIEHPLPADDWMGMKRVFTESALPVIADESCQIESDVERCAGHFHGINIKLTKCGGLTPARRMIARARALDLKVMVGCMTESSVGISAIAHLAPLLDYVDMDGSLLLREDPTTGVTVTPTGVNFADGFGTGAALRDI